MNGPGKQWHAPKKAFRPTSGLTSYEKRAKDRISRAATKTKEKELKEEKEEERQVRLSPEDDLPPDGCEMLISLRHRNG